MASAAALFTAVIGAGPAGLLFCFVSSQLRLSSDQWQLALFDKRETYERAHRLRIDPDPYKAIQADLASPAFDAFMGFLAEEEYRPAANQLETYLAAALARQGIVREQLTIGDGPTECDLAELRFRLEHDGRLASSTRLTIVGADSVNSSVRQLVGADDALVRHTHQSVARLKLEGPGLPRRLGRIEQFKMAKVLGSVLDYRLNQNGYGEVDLFLPAEEHHRVTSLGAVPARPLRLDAERLEQLGTPFFASTVRHLADNVGTGTTTAALQSTFRLEHQYSPRVTFDFPYATVFLVGDAAISLPYFRGMASLGTNVHALARAHAAVLEGEQPSVAAARYEAKAAAVAAREVTTVRRRDRLVRAAREVVQVSAVVPFPIQSWFLSAEPDDRQGRMTGGVMANLLLATLAGAIALIAPILGGYVSAPLGWVWLAAVPVEAIGGYAFETARALDGRANRWLSLVWQVQISVLLVAGVPLTIISSRALGRPAQLYAMVSWFILGLAFVAGMYAFGRRPRVAA